MRSAPLVYVQPQAQRQASRILGPGVAIERQVAESIGAGRITFGRARLIHGDGWTAEFVRRPGRLRPRPRAWQIISFQAANHPKDRRT